MLAEAYQRGSGSATPEARVRLEAAGYLAPGHKPVSRRDRARLERAGLGGEFTYAAPSIARKARVSQRPRCAVGTGDIR